LVNEQRIAAPTELYHHDEVRFGMGGPVMRFNSPMRPAPLGSSLAGQRAVAAEHAVKKIKEPEVPGSKTMVFQLDRSLSQDLAASASEPQLLMSLSFGAKDKLTIGRASGNDIKLDGLQISNRHARLTRSGERFSVDDLG